MPNAQTTKRMDCTLISIKLIKSDFWGWGLSVWPLQVLSPTAGTLSRTSMARPLEVAALRPLSEDASCLVVLLFYFHVFLFILCFFCYLYIYCLCRFFLTYFLLVPQRGCLDRAGVRPNRARPLITNMTVDRAAARRDDGVASGYVCMHKPYIYTCMYA